MKQFLNFLKHLFSFRGRARRREWWLCYFSLLLIAALYNYFALRKIDYVIISNERYHIGGLICVGLYFIIFGLATVRRLHDIGRSAWWLLFIFISVVLLDVWNGQFQPYMWNFSLTPLWKNIATCLIVILNFISLSLIFSILFGNSEIGENEYGVNPKGIDGEDIWYCK